MCRGLLGARLFGGARHYLFMHVAEYYCRHLNMHKGLLGARCVWRSLTLSFDAHSRMHLQTFENLQGPSRCSTFSAGPDIISWCTLQNTIASASAFSARDVFGGAWHYHLMHVPECICKHLKICRGLLGARLYRRGHQLMHVAEYHCKHLNMGTSFLGTRCFWRSLMLSFDAHSRMHLQTFEDVQGPSRCAAFSAEPDVISWRTLQKHVQAFAR